MYVDCLSCYNRRRAAVKICNEEESYSGFKSVTMFDIRNVRGPVGGSEDDKVVWDMTKCTLFNPLALELDI